jgi:hypothetical protein
MGTELPTKVMLGQTLVLIQMTFLNNVRKVGRLVLSRTSCLILFEEIITVYTENHTKHNKFRLIDCQAGGTDIHNLVLKG